MHDFTEQQSMYTRTRWLGASNGNWSPELRNGAAQHLPINFSKQGMVLLLFFKPRLSIEDWLSMKQSPSTHFKMPESKLMQQCLKLLYTRGWDTLKAVHGDSFSYITHMTFWGPNVSVLSPLPTVNKECFNCSRWSQTQMTLKRQRHLCMGENGWGWSIHDHTKAALSETRVAEWWMMTDDERQGSQLGSRSGWTTSENLISKPMTNQVPCWDLVGHRFQ